MLDWMFFKSDQEPGVQLPVLVVYDLPTGAVMAMQSTKDSSVETVAAVAQTLETWGHTDVVLHADGEPCSNEATICSYSGDILELSNGECDLHPQEHPIVDKLLHLDDSQSFEYGILDLVGNGRGFLGKPSYCISSSIG